MKTLILLFSIVGFTQAFAQTRCISEGYVVTPSQQKNMDNIEELVAKYDSYVYLKRQQSIRLKYHFNSCDTFQLLGGHNNEGKIVLEVYSGALKNFDENSIVTAICHEIGHILGEITLEDAGIHGRVISQNAVEGEADYFAGKCTFDFFKDIAKTKLAIRSTYETLYRKEIDESLALVENYIQGNGIHSSYPSAECRLLSAFLGLENKPRPSCWYNPK